MNKKDNKIIRFPKQIHVPIGKMIFVFIFVYVVFHLISYLLTDQVSVYEVEQGTIVTNLKFQGLALRQEQIVTANEEGNVTYYSQNNQRVGAKTIICAIDQSGTIAQQEQAIKNQETNTAINTSSLQSSVANFAFEFDKNNFSKTKDFKTDLSSELSELYSRQIMEQLSEDILQAEASGTYHRYYGAIPGLINYHIDGLEGITVESFSEDMFDNSKIKSKNLKEQTKVMQQEALYKLITSDYWQLVIPLDEVMANQLKEHSYLEIRFTQDYVSTWAQCEVIEKSGKQYLLLTFDDSVERYADSRIINIEILLEQENGLKVPNSCITKKTFFTVPISYFQKGNNSNSETIMIQQNDGTVKVVSPTIYHQDEKYYYIDDEFVSTGDILQKPDSSHTYQIGDDKEKLIGVYNVNKGYAVFKKIDVLYQNEDYSIVKSGTAYGISLYDHIVLQGDSVKENQMIQ